MKKVILLSLASVLSYSIYACSCFPWQENFYDNIRPGSVVGLFRIDSMWTETDTNHMSQVPFATFTVLKDYSLDSLKVGDKVPFLGQDGINCAVGFGQFTLGDTIMASIHYDGHSAYPPYPMFFIPFWSPTGCGTHYIKITNGMNNGKDMNQLESDLNRYLTGVEDHEFSELTIGPNPVNDVLYIKGLSEKNVEISIYSISGVMIKVGVYFGSDLKVDFSDIQSGLYIVKISDGDRSRSLRIMKE